MKNLDTGAEKKFVEKKSTKGIITAIVVLYFVFNSVKPNNGV